MICEYCNTEHPESQIANPHYCIARLGEQSDKKDMCIAALTAELEQWKLSRDGVMSTIERLTADNARLREALEDWLNFSIDVYTSDFPGMEWLINLQKKTSELIAQDAIGKEAK